MTGPVALVIAVGVLAGALAIAIRGNSRLLEGPIAAAGAFALVLLGVVPAAAAGTTVRDLAGTVAFLGAILILGHLLAEEGVFTYFGRLAATRSRGTPRRLLGYVVVMAGAVTAVLTLDTTVVLLTPVVVAATLRMRTPSAPHTFALVRIANSGSLLLPVSNLTNLLAFGAAGLTFGRFAALLAVPWVAILITEWAVARIAFREQLAPASSDGSRDIRDGSSDFRDGSRDFRDGSPRVALGVLVVTVCGFVVLSAFGLSPAWMAAASALVLGVRRLVRKQTDVRRIIGEANPSFLLFVLALGVIVDGVSRHGGAALLGRLLPAGHSLPALLVIALLAALVANLVNNIPATLVLLPLVAGAPLAVLAVLIGVNLGPNLTYGGSLATLLWRRVVAADLRPSAKQFHVLGLMSVVPIILMATCLLWLSAKLIGV
ncbi:arsenite efflux membrane protein ArsB [Antricoccus suffuscus]|uniref:Arsenite efflux membrane protein ArsB n=1 Tax=Antricoccus suffuscus TaxID=1629062 RepID=A0A2T0ZX57_9ACTN|nr:SLC13 family permease [Antricoccus suffuscus]PRZ40945.1 arsenite efflux membrane protein ArsB [Antricoccus suffuscus]